MFKSKKVIKISIIIILLILVGIAIILANATGTFEHIIKQYQESQQYKGVPEFSYDVYSNEKGIVVGINVVEESGIKEIKYPNSDFTLYCNGRQRVSIDYKIEEKTDYIFKVTNENNEIKEHTLRIESIDDYIKIDVTTDKELDTSGKVNVTYGVAGRTNQYAIGKNNNTWTNYSKEFDIDSYTIINKNLGNADKTVTIKARTVDSAGNIVQIEKTISCLDIDLPTAPKITIKSDNAYSVITEHGVQVQATIVDIEYDTRNDITNYYSIDGGLTWKVFTNSVKSSNVVCPGIIKAKSVKNASGLEISSSKDITTLVSDSVGAEAYDGNVSTSYVVSSTTKKMLISEDMYGKNIYVNGVSSVYRGGCYIRFYNSEGTLLSSKTLATTTSSWSGSNLQLTVPTGSTEVRFVATDEMGKITIYEIGPANEPIITATKAYPLLTELGVEQGYSTATISYDSASVQKLYKINDGAWKTYENKPIKLKLGDTIYAKGIDKYGKDTRTIPSCSVSLASDALGLESYDSNTTTSYLVSSTTKKMLISEDMYGKNIYVNGTSSVYRGGCYIRFYNSEGTVLSSKTLATTTSSWSNSNLQLTVPTGSTEIRFVATDEMGKITIYETGPANEPIITETKVYPIITESGVEQGYSTATISYDSTSVQKLYKINDGAWKTYENKPIKLNLGDTIYAKGIDKYGKDTRIIPSCTATIASDALGVEAYDKNASTAYNFTQGTKKIYVSEGMQGKYITITGEETAYSGSCSIKFLSSDGTVLNTITCPGWGGWTVNNASYTIPSQCTEIRFYASANSVRYFKIYEIGPKI